MYSSILIITLSGHGFGQHQPTSTGGDATGTTGSVSYSVGQVFYHIQSSVSGIIFEGMQQSHELFILSSGQTEFEATIKVFPNPASYQLTIQVQPSAVEQYQYQLLDIQGRQVRASSLNTPQSEVDVSVLPAGMYLLRISSSNGTAQTIKIIKN